jgi:hypothetical protein
VGRYRQYSYGLVQEQVAGFFESGNEFFGSPKGYAFLEQKMGFLILKENSAPWSEVE